MESRTDKFRNRARTKRVGTIEWRYETLRLLTSAEKSGFLLFFCKASCVRCHSGSAFTDDAFHDIGLAAGGKGCGGVIGRAPLDHAVKTPTLRELVWTAPYMNDGSLSTLDEVVRHYESGGVERESRSPDMPRGLRLTDRECGDLVAFLRSLSSDCPSHTPSETTPRTAETAVDPVRGRSIRVGQRDKVFQPRHVSIQTGDTLILVNDDMQLHNVFVADPRMTFDSGWQEPGQEIDLPFKIPGEFEAFCGIHLNMRLRVEVAPGAR